MTDDQHNIVLALDKLDEELISKELQGVFVDTLVYEYDIKDKSGKPIKQRALSYSGVLELVKIAVTHGAQVTVLPAEIKETDTAYEVQTKAIYKPGNSDGSLEIWGYARQPKIMTYKGKDGLYHKKEDEFAFVKATSKAQRNVLRKVISEKWALEIINRWVEGRDEYGRTMKTKVVTNVTDRIYPKMNIVDAETNETEEHVDETSNDINHKVDGTRSISKIMTIHLIDRETNDTIPTSIRTQNIVDLLNNGFTELTKTGDTRIDQIFKHDGLHGVVLTTKDEGILNTVKTRLIKAMQQQLKIDDRDNPIDQQRLSKYIIEVEVEDNE